jgi:linoleate 10R-lipoxygenase
MGTTGLKKVGPGLETHHEVPTKQPVHATSRSEAESSFTQFAHLVHAAQRPLPNQSGDGTYMEEKQQHSSL